MKPIMRQYQAEDDYWRIHMFLRQVYLFSGRRELSWQTDRFDYWRWRGIRDFESEHDVFIWESNGEMVAILELEGPGKAFSRVHPAFRTPELEQEMLSVALDQRVATGRINDV